MDKDIVAEDIIVDEVNGRFGAFLTLGRINGNRTQADAEHSKLYYANGVSRNDAVNRLLTTVIEHLEHLKVGDGHYESL